MSTDNQILIMTATLVTIQIDSRSPKVTGGSRWRLSAKSQSSVINVLIIELFIWKLSRSTDLQLIFDRLMSVTQKHDISNSTSCSMLVQPVDYYSQTNVKY